MKTTGVSRRIDNLGRIVIPKEIRKELKIRDGELLEITVEDENVILSKHSSMKSIVDIARMCIDAISSTLNVNMLITDRDRVIAASPQLRKKYLDKDLSIEISEILLKPNSVIERETKNLKIDNDNEEITTYVAHPIVVDSDIVGSALILGLNSVVNENDEKMASFIANFLARNILE